MDKEILHKISKMSQDEKILICNLIQMGFKFEYDDVEVDKNEFRREIVIKPPENVQIKPETYQLLVFRHLLEKINRV